MYNQHFQIKLTIRQFHEFLVDKLLKLEPTSKTAISHKSATPKLVKNKFQRRLGIKHKLEGTKDKCQRNKKKRRKCTECF